MENAPSNNEASSGTSELDDGLGFWRLIKQHKINLALF